MPQTTTEPQPSFLSKLLSLLLSPFLYIYNLLTFRTSPSYMSIDEQIRLSNQADADSNSKPGFVPFWRSSSVIEQTRAEMARRNVEKERARMEEERELGEILGGFGRGRDADAVSGSGSGADVAGAGAGEGRKRKGGNGE